jgi:excinuclease ABC subunit C
VSTKEFNDIRHSFPNEPGIYKYFDANNQIIYVGKAKNLYKRIAQYFLENKQDSAKTILLVKTIARIEYTIVNNEHDALLLENSLIKEFKPKYNIRLKDDKSYPFIIIKNEQYPRIFFTRKIIKDGSEYLGPYTSTLKAKEILELLKRIFPLRSCNLNLTPKNIQAKKFKVCLEYHIGNCKGPCENKQSEAEYDEMIQQIRNILKGKFSFVSAYLTNKMEQCAEALKFEEAEMWKKKFSLFEDYQSKTVIVNPYYNDLVVSSLAAESNKAVVNFLEIANGSIVTTQNVEVEKKLNESEAEILEFAVNDFLQSRVEVKELIVPYEIAVSKGIKLTVPQIGDKKALLDISYKNAKIQLFSTLQEGKFERKKKEYDVLQELKEKLRMKEMPLHIECFDNSNIQGNFPVSACVVFKNGKPSKKDYRHFNVKTVQGPNDFDTMKEVVYRRYKRMLEEAETLPQLIIIDGGKGQLSAAVEVLEELKIDDKVCIIGIAKRLEEIYYKNDPLPLYIDKKSPALKLIQQMRDEAHRFGITFHRNKRSQHFTKNIFEEVAGVGPQTQEILYKKFKSINKMREAGYDAIKELVGVSKANKVWEVIGSISTS